MPDQQLSEHFSLAELVKSDVAIRKGIDNTTSDPVIIAALRQVTLNILEPVRSNFNIAFAPNSGYRCLALNTAIGSAPSSQHVLGQAVDFELPGMSNFDLASWVAAHLDYDQLILEFYKSGQPSSGWVHCSFVRTGANRKQALTTADGRTFTRGLVQ